MLFCAHEHSHNIMLLQGLVFTVKVNFNKILLRICHNRMNYWLQPIFINRRSQEVPGEFAYPWVQGHASHIHY